MGTDCVCGVLFCAAKWSGAFPPIIPVGLRARASRLGGFTSQFSGLLLPQGWSRLFVITDYAATSRPRSALIKMGWWSEHCNGFTEVLIAAGGARQHHEQYKG
jgi:hypothetical protein